MWSAQFSQRRARLAGRGRKDLLASAATVIAERGLANTRFSDVADATGVAVSTLQYLYGSREDLTIAILEYATEDELRRLQEVAAHSPNPRERLTRLVELCVGDTGAARESTLLS